MLRRAAQAAACGAERRALITIACKTSELA
jgi:hypothetical protein